MADIYELHTKAFARVSAYVIAHKGERVATIAFKFPADGAGRLYAYVHWLGVPMVRGFASGYGYDKRSAAVDRAQRNIMVRHEREREIFANPVMQRFLDALTDSDGQQWDNRLLKAGFEVWQAV